MSKELMAVLITKMHIRLNRLIEECNFNLLNKDVLSYSRRLDKVLTHYNKVTQNKPKCNQSPIPLSMT